MRYKCPILEARFINRINRFICTVEYENRSMTILCPNTGSMAGLLEAGNRVRMSGPHLGWGRKYLYTLEQIEITRVDGEKVWVGVNTQTPNYVIAEAIENGRLFCEEEILEVKREVGIAQGSRIDILILNHRGERRWVEVKNVTLVLSNPREKKDFNSGSIAAFPDAVTKRGIKHIYELMKKLRIGDRAAMVYCIQREDAKSFAPAECFDPDYAEELRKAARSGLEIIPAVCVPEKRGVSFRKVVPCDF